MANTQEIDCEVTAEQISNTRTIGSNAIWTILGRVGPMMFAVLLTPALIRQLGPDRWGVFTIALSLIGIFGVFDFGIGRAITRNIAEAVGQGTVGELASQVKTSLALLLGFGLSGSIIMTFLVQYWVRSSLKLPPTLVQEVSTSLYILCLSVPLILLGSGMWGILTAYQRTKSATMISTPILVLYYAGPLLVFQLYRSLIPIISLIVILRLIVTLLFWRLCKASIPKLSSAPIDFSTLKPVFRLSGWMTISNLLGPILSYIDRFTIASFISAAAVGYYSTAGDLITRLYLIPTAITNSVFPAVAASQLRDPIHACQIIRRAIVTITSAIFPFSIIFLLFGSYLLQLWLGPEIASHISPLLPWFSLGLIFAASDTLIMGVIDCLGFPKVNSQFSMVELVVYVPLMALCLKYAGIQGAAIAWFLRAVFDLVVRLVLLTRVFPIVRHHLWPLCFTPALGAGLAVLCLFAASTPLKVLALLATSATYGFLLWSFSLAETEKVMLQGKLARSFQRA